MDSSVGEFAPGLGAGLGAGFGAGLGVGFGRALAQQANHAPAGAETDLRANEAIGGAPALQDEVHGYQHFEHLQVVGVEEGVDAGGVEDALCCGFVPEPIEPAHGGEFDLGVEAEDERGHGFGLGRLEGLEGLHGQLLLPLRGCTTFGLRLEICERIQTVTEFAFFAEVFTKPGKMLWLDFTCYQKCRNRPFLGEICENFFAKRVGPNFRPFDELKKAEFLTFV